MKTSEREKEPTIIERRNRENTEKIVLFQTNRIGDRKWIKKMCTNNKNSNKAIELIVSECNTCDCLLLNCDSIYRFQFFFSFRFCTTTRRPVEVI